MSYSYHDTVAVITLEIPLKVRKWSHPGTRETPPEDEVEWEFDRKEVNADIEKKIDEFLIDWEE